MAIAKPTAADMRKCRLRTLCVVLPLAAMLTKAVDAYLHCDRSVDYFTADLAAGLALTLGGCFLLLIDCIYRKKGPRAGTSSKRRIVYVIFQIVVLLAIIATGWLCAFGNASSAVGNGGAAKATTGDALQRLLKDSGRMDPFNVCQSNNQTRIVELHSQQPEVFRSIQRNAAVTEWFIVLTWLAVAVVGLPCVYVRLWKMTCDELSDDQGTEAGEEMQNAELAIDCVATDDSCCCCAIQ